MGKARLHKDLPIFKALKGALKLTPKQRNRTLIGMIFFKIYFILCSCFIFVKLFSDMSLSITSIDFDYASGVFKTHGWMILKWNDPRNSWDPIQYDDISSIQLPFPSWTPEVILHNSVEEKFAYRHLGVLHHNGDFVYLVSIHTKSGCKPNFEDDRGNTFPFNMQTCSLQFGSWINEKYRVEYRVPQNDGTNKTSVNLDNFMSTTGWNIHASTARLESIQYPLFMEPSNMVVFTFSFKRSIFYDPVSGILWKVRTYKQKMHKS